MSEEYVWTATTGNIKLFEMKANHNHNITFHNGNKQIGVLDFNGPEMTFSGDIDESAKAFFDWIVRSFKARLEQERADEREACFVCDQVHSILDGDESKIIRNAKDGCPDGRSPRILTLQERVMALCRYASDWKRWCLEKENTSQQPAQRTVIAPLKEDGADQTAVLQAAIDQTSPQPAPVHEMTPEMMRKVHLHSELGAYAAANLSGAYDLFAEFWRVAMSAAPQPEQEPVITKNGKGMLLHSCWDSLPDGSKLYTAPQPAPRYKA